MTAGRQAGDDRHGSAGAGIEPLDRRFRGEVERVAAERDPRGIAQTRQDRHDRFRRAVAVRVHQPDDLPGSRLGRVHRTTRTKGEEAYATHALREDADGESDGDVQHVTGDWDRVAPEPAPTPPAPTHAGGCRPRAAADGDERKQDRANHRLPPPPGLAASLPIAYA